MGVLKRSVMLAILLAMPMVGHTQTSETVTYDWTAPTTGGAVASYNVYVASNDTTSWAMVGNVPTNTWTTTWACGIARWVKVRAVGTTGLLGPFSPASLRDFAECPPGACGRPTKR